MILNITRLAPEQIEIPDHYAVDHTPRGRIVDIIGKPEVQNARAAIQVAIKHSEVTSPDLRSIPLKASFVETLRRAINTLDAAYAAWGLIGPETQWSVRARYVGRMSDVIEVIDPQTGMVQAVRAESLFIKSPAAPQFWRPLGTVWNADFNPSVLIRDGRKIALLRKDALSITSFHINPEATVSYLEEHWLAWREHA